MYRTMLLIFIHELSQRWHAGFCYASYSLCAIIFFNSFPVMFVCVCVRARIVCMVLITAEIMCTRSQNSFFSASAWGTYRFSYLRQLLIPQDNGIKVVAFDVLVQYLDHRATRVPVFPVIFSPVGTKSWTSLSLSHIVFASYKKETA